MTTAADLSQRTSDGGSPESVLRASAYDTVSSWLIALLIFVGVVVALMSVVWLTGTHYMAKVPPAIELIEAPGEDDPAEDFERDLLEPGLEEVQPTMEPQVAVTLEAVTEVIGRQEAALFHIENAIATVGVKPGHSGGSRGGLSVESDMDTIPPWERWEIQFATGGPDAYARQLDYFGIELGTAGGGQSRVEYASQLTRAAPERRSGEPSDEHRLYMSWRGDASPLADYDRQLLQKAGIPTDGRLVLQFYPRDVERQLLMLEAMAGQAHDKVPQQFLKTVFGVREVDDGFTFFVKRQEYRRKPEF